MKTELLDLSIHVGWYSPEDRLQLLNCLIHLNGWGALDAIILLQVITDCCDFLK
ncbi:hypothetical protein GDO81_002030 [Engystomops pustulosus]|uniref:Uncharacterized protein n=1 Tax=Engystomops pustulosus TaxID=76066 RepID=A0AAV7DKN5_ENGPU|nr:hypothetical protein GDO81_002030 [Engystomops pustulosus]